MSAESRKVFPAVDTTLLPSQLRLEAELLAESKRGNLRLVKVALDRGASANGSAFTTHGTPLVLASEQGWTEIASLLLQRGADVDKEDDRLLFRGTTALSHAARNGHIDVVKLLLAARARVGGVALVHAIYYGHSTVAKLLLATGTNCKIYQTDNLHPLIGACFWVSGMALLRGLLRTKHAEKTSSVLMLSQR